MYDVLPSFLLGFHGCDRSVAEAVFAGETVLKPSENSYDWLGHGIYFWESSPARAIDFARLLASGRRRPTRAIKEPAVVGAVIDLGRCLNLLDAHAISIVRDGYLKLRAATSLLGEDLPRNAAPSGSSQLLLRHLDCAVIEWVHHLRIEESEPPFDSVRGVFVEGAPLYENAGFHEKSHVQICVRDPRCIKGYFRALPNP